MLGKNCQADWNSKSQAETQLHKMYKHLRDMVAIVICYTLHVMLKVTAPRGGETGPADPATAGVIGDPAPPSQIP